MQLSLLDLCAPPAPALPPAATSPAVEAALAWLDADPSAGRWAEWLVAGDQTVAIMYRTVGLDGLSDSGKGSAAFFRCDRVVARIELSGDGKRAAVEAEARRLGLV